jgi:hypothetical protein
MPDNGPGREQRGEECEGRDVAVHGGAGATVYP